MILADKIIKLRKKNSWSQEELAEKMKVSRQAVSKWEGAQSFPDPEKILQLSLLFEVTTDYLLKDEIEDEESPQDVSSESVVKRITIEEACDYLRQRKRASRQIALATLLCILSPITLILLSLLAVSPNPILTEAMAGGIGLTVLFALLLCAVPIYIYCGFKNQPYEFLDKNQPFELAYGVKGMVNEKKAAFRPTYVTSTIIATCLCIFSVVPLLMASFTGKDLLVGLALALLLIIVGIGVGLFIIVGVQYASMQKLLREGDFTEEEKKKTGLREVVGSCYWGGLTALFLAASFLTHKWDMTWVIFAVGVVLFPVVMCICNLIADRQKKN